MPPRCYVSCVTCEPVDGDGMRGISHEGGHGRMVQQLAQPLLRDEPPTCFFSPSLPCACSFCFSNFPLSRALRAVPLNQSRQIVVI